MRGPAVALPELVLADELPPVAVLAVPTASGDGTARPAGALPDGLVADVDALLARETATGSAGELVGVPVLDQGPLADGPLAGVLERLLLVGTGAATPAELRKAGAALARRAKDAASLAVDLRGLEVDGAGLRALAEGLLLASYGFSRKAEPKARALTRVVLVGPVALQPDLDAALAVIAATAVARDLVNTPSLAKSPAWFAERAQALLDGLDVRVLDEHELAERGFGGILGVGQGSSRPPRLVTAHYDGTAHIGGGAGPHVALVGKGITFDSGGLSLKPTASMVEMKSDMGGAAAVVATLAAVADLGLPLRVTALAALAENMPSGTAQRPGDVLRQYGGRTVEVLNTDAEGRLVLADALVHAHRDLGADVLVDVATLTGAMPVALGKRCAGMFASDDALAAQLEAAAEACGEQLWRMPLVDDYRQALDSPIADLRNIGQPRLKLQGGSITAALFLREFTAGLPWAHLDIAGPAFTGADEEERTKGGTGYGVRLLTAWLTSLAADAARTRPAA